MYVSGGVNALPLLTDTPLDDPANVHKFSFPLFEPGNVGCDSLPRGRF
jgi:hypothetical protein